MEHAATFRFYEELNDFLPEGDRKRPRQYGFDGTPGVKDAIEAQGIPHTEVDLILVNGEPARFDYRLRDGDFVSVFPVFETLDISPINRLRPDPLRNPRFVADANLGKLARRLRLLGFDTLYRSDFGDDEVVRLARDDDRIIVTRDRKLLHRADVVRGYWVRSTRPEEQAREVVRRFHLRGRIRPLSRCSLCNAMVTAVDKAEVKDRLPPGTLREHERFYRCSGCGQVYWRGAHSKRLDSLIERMTDSSG